METKNFLEKIATNHFLVEATNPFFFKKVASENGWTLAYTRRVVREYQRFLYMSTFDNGVTPSDQVDQVWHAHILHTYEYAEFCKNVLGTFFHHGPSRGSTEDDEKYNDWYSKTKERYQDLFNESPPEDIWPLSTIRFNSHHVRLDVTGGAILFKRMRNPVLYTVVYYALRFLNVFLKKKFF